MARLISYQVINENILTIGLNHLVAYKRHCQCFLSDIPSALIPPRWPIRTTADLIRISTTKKLEPLLHTLKTFDRNTNHGKLSTEWRAIEKYLVLKYLKKLPFCASHDYRRTKSLSTMLKRPKLSHQPANKINEVKFETRLSKNLIRYLWATANILLPKFQIDLWNPDSSRATTIEIHSIIILIESKY